MIRILRSILLRPVLRNRTTVGGERLLSLLRGLMRCTKGTGRALPPASTQESVFWLARLSRRRDSAMTLMEVMVVTGSVGVMAALLLPALANARAKVHRLECISRLKQWNVAFRSFAEENEDWIARECYEPL